MNLYTYLCKNNQADHVVKVLLSLGIPIMAITFQTGRFLSRYPGKSGHWNNDGTVVRVCLQNNISKRTINQAMKQNRVYGSYGTSQ